MGSTIFVIILVIIAIAILAKGHLEWVDNGETHKFPIRPFGWGVLVLAILCLFIATITTVDGGNVGVVKTFGKYSSGTLGSGLHLVAPWSEVSEVNVQTRTYTMSQGNEGSVSGDDSISVQTSDNASVNEDVTIRYEVSSSAAANLIKNVGTDFVNQLLRPSAQTNLRNEADAFDSTTFVTTGRTKYAGAVLVAMQKDLDHWGISIEEVQVRHQRLPAALQAAANNKVKAAQDADTELQRLRAAGTKADITRTEAKATADSQQILACGSTTATDAAGNLIVTPKVGTECDQSQLTPAFLQFLWTQAVEKIASSKNNSTLILPQNAPVSTPIIGGLTTAK